MRRIGAGLVVLGLLAAPSSARPAKGWRPPVLVSDTKASVETSLAVNPRNPDDVLLCSPSGVPNVPYGQSYFHRSTDGGRTWRYLDVEGLVDTRGATFEGGDCDVAYDAGGTMWVADTWVGNLSVGHSRDGTTWTGSAVTTSGTVVDRPWLVGGPPGTLYVVFHDAQCCMPSAMFFTKTTDYGATFSPAVPITVGGSADEGLHTWMGNLVVSPSGRDLYVVYSRRVLAASLVEERPVQMMLAASHDGGATWAHSRVATIPRETRTIYPSVGLDAGGHLHAVWSMPRENDVPAFYTSSKDRGRTWAAPRVLNAGGEALAPWVVGGARGQARIAWLGAPDHAYGAHQSWYFYWAKVDGGRVGVGTTTRTPIHVGARGGPEFETARVDRHGRMHLGMSVYLGDTRWATYYQREN